jgi:hypothetical protein
MLGLETNANSMREYSRFTSSVWQAKDLGGRYYLEKISIYTVLAAAPTVEGEKQNKDHQSKWWGSGGL